MFRFRSITQQYYRKADGILSMYDISDGDSFLAVRQWLDCVQVSKGALTLNQLWNKYLKKKLYVMYCT